MKIKAMYEAGEDVVSQIGHRQKRKPLPDNRIIELIRNGFSCEGVKHELGLGGSDISSRVKLLGYAFDRKRGKWVESLP